MLQVWLDKRVTAAKFFSENLHVTLSVLCEQAGIEDCGDDIVEGMRAGGDTKASNCKKDGEIDACKCAKSETGNTEGLVEVVVETKQHRRDNNGKNDRAFSA